MNDYLGALSEVQFELQSALIKHKKIISAHEGYAILLEEVDELWDEVKKKENKRNYNKIKEEAKQIAAVAIRMMVELS